MRRYETIAILDPDLSENQRTAVFTRLQELIPEQGGFLAFVDEWGSRQLGYEIKKRERGYYVRFDYCGTGAVVDEIERLFRIDDGVLKYMTVLTDDDPNLDSVKEEIARAEAERAKIEEAETNEASEPIETQTSQDEATDAPEPPQSQAPDEEATEATEPAETKTSAADSTQASDPPETEALEDTPSPSESKKETEKNGSKTE